MIANVSAHRRANAFAQALEEQSDRDPAARQPAEPAAQHSDQAESGQDRLLSLAEGLGDLPRPELDPEVKVVQRAQLVAAMEAMFKEGANPAVPEQRKSKGAHRATPLGKLRPRSRLSKGIAAGGLTVGVAAGAFSGVAAASSDALPGDSLYGLKRGMEDVKLGMADSDSDRGQIYLDQASTRLSEARRLMDRGGRTGQLDHESVGEVRRALSGMRYDASEGHRLLSEAYKRDGSLGPIQALSSFTESHRKTWTALSGKLPVQLGDVRDEVSSVFAAIDEEVGPLRSLLPRTPDRGGSSDPARDGATAPGASGTDSSTPSGSSSPEHSAGSSTKPKPSSSGTGKEDDGLLGGAAGGLLDPPEDKPSTSPTDGRSGSGSTAPAQPDVTLPPLLPGILPGLGIEGEDAN
ncbi:DUF5667 domain-containing protein [Streptomyces xanthii]|uniref:DUF5667 domain-containing protein n=1 Tax=Streptomyces xanthii TaxID=2768069 RepID=A0A7H1BA82_9ACTN|nr:DUF5667 domain-containing protein [Streptomyces xanthii]QNS05637.1 hypothetical protein IAG42_19955 [Streptomyces xanthii]